jgi:AraC-like DNA-binding protein
MRVSGTSRAHLPALWLQHYISSYNDLWSQVDFRLIMAFDVVAVPHWRFENDIQPVPEVWRVRSGRCIVRVGEREVTAQSGDTVILTAGEHRLTINPDDEPLDIVGFGCTARLFGGTDLISLLQPPLCVRADGASPNRLDVLLEGILRETRGAGAGASLAASGLAQLALVEALRSCTAQGEDDTQSLEERVLLRLQAAHSGDIAHALQLIAAQYAEPLDVAQMARAAHLSPAHFARKFKATLGLTPMEYLRDYRLRQARTQLSGSDASIAHIAAQCGFEDAAYFSRAFKAQFGSSPLELRRYMRGLSK